MKKLLTITLLFFVTISFSQRWSAYGIKVSPQNEETVVKLMDDYFSLNKIEGVTVTLYSIMFTPGDLNFTHEIIFSHFFFPTASQRTYLPKLGHFSDLLILGWEKKFSFTVFEPGVFLVLLITFRFTFCIWYVFVSSPFVDCEM